MKDVLHVKASVREWYNRNGFAYTDKNGSISEHGADINELCGIIRSYETL